MHIENVIFLILSKNAYTKFSAGPGIVSLHVIGLGGMEIIPNGTLPNAIVRYIWIVSFISVNIFGILTGYLNCNKKTQHWNRILDLLVVVAFWSVFITAAFGACKTNLLVGWKDYMVSLFPALQGRYWYITSYVFVYFKIPYLMSTEQSSVFRTVGKKRVANPKIAKRRTESYADSAVK